MKQTWSIRERMFKEDYKRRMKMFNTLVGSMALYEEEFENGHDGRMDGVKRKYVK